jgi:trans-aconitate methyltransferase
VSALAEAWASRGGDDWVAHCRDLDGGGRPHRLALLRALLSFRPVRSVAEVGCGAGANLRLIRLTFPSAALTGVDVNRALAAQAADRAEQVELIDVAFFGVHAGADREFARVCV